MRARGVARGVRGSGSGSRFLQGRALRLLLGFGSLLGGLRAYNVELKRPLVFRGPNGTFFGYSVLAHHHGSRSWLLAGAPRSSSNFLEAQRPGAVYRCAVRSNPRRFCQEMHIGTRKARHCGRTCREERDDQWLGVSMARQPQDDGFLVCAHRWKNVYYQTDHKLPLGACFLISKHASTSTSTINKPFVPCFKEHKKNYGEEHGSCQAGIASTFAQDSMVLGAPGSYYWTGSVIVLNLTSSITTFYREPEGGRTLVGYSSYLGYSVAAGSFLRPKSMEVVGGAPQHANTGKVYIFKVESSGLQVLHEIAGKMVGSYFGAALCAVDLNSDGLSDLLVGAPMTSRVRDEGRVHVYINRGNSDLEEQEPPLSGSDAFSAHFGAAISSLGDVDDDSFEDVAVGAPLEDDFGVVYIYHGNPRGLTSKHSQKIHGRNVSPGVQMFGQSISGGVDLDGNGYPDIAIGAFRSDVAALYRTRPVITVQATIRLPPFVNLTEPLCGEASLPILCFNASVCLSFHGRSVPRHIELKYELMADAKKRATGEPSRLQFTGSGPGSAPGHLELTYALEACHTHHVLVKRDVKDVISPLTFELNYQLKGQASGKRSRQRRSPEDFPLLRPVLRWNQGRGTSAIAQTVFERNCLNPDCTTDLRVEATLIQPGVSPGRPYLVIGAARSASLNISVLNRGDDAYDTHLFISFPKELYFVKVQQVEEDSVRCELLWGEDQVETSRLRCSISLPYLPALSQRNFSVILDTTLLGEEDPLLRFSLLARSVSLEHNSTLADNLVHLYVPTRFLSDTTVKGWVSPPSFVYGEEGTNISQFEQIPHAHCLYQWMNFSFQVVNLGPSPVPGALFELLIPNRLSKDGPEIFHIQQAVVEFGNGHCIARVPSQLCLVPHDQENIFRTLFSIFTKSGRKILDCSMRSECLNVLCMLGTLPSERSLSINITTLLNTNILEKDSSSVIQFVAEAIVRMNRSLRAYEVPHGEPDNTAVIFEALHELRPRGHVAAWIIALSLLIGILIFILLATLLWKLGFFKRAYKEKMEASMEQR